MNLTLSTKRDDSQLPESGGQTTIEVAIDPSGDAAGTAERHVVFCIDTSSSMSASDLATVSEGVTDAAAELAADDCVAVAEFATEARPVVEPVDGARFDGAGEMETLVPEGGCDVLSGLATARDLLDRMPDDGDRHTDRSVYLFTAGEPDAATVAPFESVKRSEWGPGDRGLYEATAAAFEGDDVAVHAAAVGGSGFGVVEALGVASGGEWEYVVGAGEVESFVRSRLRHAQNVVASDLSLELTPRNGVTLDDVVQLRPRTATPEVGRRDGGCAIEVPEVDSTRPPRFFVEVTVPEQEVGLGRRLVDVELADGATRIAESVEAKVVADELRSSETDDELRSSETERGPHADPRPTGASNTDAVAEDRTPVRAAREGDDEAEAEDDESDSGTGS